MSVRRLTLWTPAKSLGTNYIFWALALSTSAYATHSWFATEYVQVGPLTAGRPASLATGVVMMTVLARAWLLAPGDVRMTDAKKLVFIPLLALWLIAMLAGSVRGQSIDFSSVLLPVLVAMILAKPPSQLMVTNAAVAWAWLVTALSVIDLVWIGPTYGNPEGLFFDRKYLSDFGVFQLDWRWSGPFGNVNFSGPTGCILVMLAVTLRGRRLLLPGITGVLILAMSESRFAVAATIAGLIVAMVFRLRSWTARLSLLVAGLVSLTLAILMEDPTLGGRTGLWLNLLAEASWISLSGVEIEGFPHAHSVFLEVYLKAGVLGVAVLAVQIGAILRVVSQMARSSLPVCVPLLVSTLILLASDLIVQWSSVGFFFPAYLAVLLITSSQPNQYAPRGFLGNLKVFSPKEFGT